MKSSVKTKDIHKNEKRNTIDIKVFGYENKVKCPIYKSKECFEEKYVDLWSTGKNLKLSMFLSKILKPILHDYTLHHRRKHLCCYWILVQKK